MKRVNVAYCLIYDEENEQVLMVYNKDVDSWSMPGGAVEDDETLEQAAIREVKEETGLLVEISDVVAVNECLFKRKNEHAIFITFRAKITGGKISIESPNEISKIIWMDIPTADKLMPYHKCGVSKLIHNSSIYCFQGQVQ